MKVYGLILLLIAVATAASIRKADFDPAVVLSEIDQTPFGNGLISMVAVHLSSQSPIDELIVILNQIRSDIAKQQEKSDNENRTIQAECDSIIAAYQQQINQASNQKSENEKIRELNQAALNVAQKDLREALSSLDVNARRLRTGQAERDQQHNDYTSRMYELESGIHALDGALQLLQHLQAGTASFIQLKRRFDKVMQELIDVSASAKQGSLYTPLITALADLASKANSEVIAKIITLFNELRQTFVGEKQSATNIENKQLDDWLSLKTDMDLERQQLNDKRTDLERQIEGYTKIISDSAHNIKSLTTQIDAATDNLNRATTDCKTYSENYETTTRERAREADIVQRIITFFEKKAKTTTDAIKGRVEKAML